VLLVRRTGDLGQVPYPKLGSDPIEIKVGHCLQTPYECASRSPRQYSDVHLCRSQRCADSDELRQTRLNGPRRDTGAETKLRPLDEAWLLSKT
jgi:hypothetical protein